eukprot:NODE_394_length_1802_cov_76.847690_g331_i0.p2 GENE.NODE_394_length_1802_cov_76.847690_g331_i0~~NODE_394_length_1802_cov_76.847690_g331_i0.p2  ORF type:complete len:145 (-),score=42.61 NODE_394_length_1802_cov_76.847690_g331_i0:925-1359(-)
MQSLGLGSQRELFTQGTRYGEEVMVRYTVDFPPQPGGLLLLADDNFLQLFQPPNESTAKAFPMDIVFVIDKSGSMSGDKMSQTKQAFVSIVSTLKPTDFFTVIVFANEHKVWQPLTQATPTAKEQAKNSCMMLRQTAGPTSKGP